MYVCVVGMRGKIKEEQEGMRQGGDLFLYCLCTRGLRKKHKETKKESRQVLICCVVDCCVQTVKRECANVFSIFQIWTTISTV